MQLQPLSAPLAVTTQSRGSGGSFEDMTSFLNQQQDKFVSLLREERETAERQRQEMEAKAERDRAELQAKLDAQRDDKLHEERVVALQARLDAMHAAKLLADAELYAVEDIVADGGEQVAALLELSGRMVRDSAFSRQLRRKYA